MVPVPGSAELGSLWHHDGSLRLGAAHAQPKAAFCRGCLFLAKPDIGGRPMFSERSRCVPKPLRSLLEPDPD